MTGDAPRPAPASSAPDEVPRLPRGRGLRLSRIELLRIAGLAILLIFLLATQRQCADAVSTFVTSFGDQKPAQPRPSPAATTGSGSAAIDVDRYERLRPGMTDAEMKATIERAKARAAAQRSAEDPAH